jgi:hypothetical protein
MFFSFNKRSAMGPSAWFSDIGIGIISVANSFLKLNSIMQLSISSAIVFSAVLLIPKAGPRRAIMLALRSFVRRGPEFASMRTGDKGVLLSTLKTLGRDKFIVCQGPCGIGKTHLVRDALARTLGVVHVKITPGTAHADILKEGHAAIANIKLGPTVVNPALDSRRVLWWYRLLFRRSPIVVISAAERTAEHIQKGIRLADIPGAARELAADGFRVIVDASENSISNDPTLREKVLHVSPLPVEVLFIIVSICFILSDPSRLHSRGIDSASLNCFCIVQSYRKDPEFEALFKLLGELGIRDAHLRALDGKPTYLVDIQSDFTDLIGDVDSFDVSRLKKEPAVCDQLRSIVLTLLQAQVIFCWLFLISEQYTSSALFFSSYWSIIRVSFCVSQIKLTRKVWTHVPIPLCPVAIDAFKCSRSAMQGVQVGALPSLTPRTFEELSACKAFRVLSNGNLAPASSALLLLLRRGDAFSPATLDECIIEELEDEIKPNLPAAPAHVES